VPRLGPRNNSSILKSHGSRNSDKGGRGDKKSGRRPDPIDLSECFHWGTTHIEADNALEGSRAREGLIEKFRGLRVHFRSDFEKKKRSEAGKRTALSSRRSICTFHRPGGDLRQLENVM